MKKILLFVAVSVLTLSSCSSDDDNGGGSTVDSITMKIGGVSKTFDHVVVNEQDEGEGDVYLTVSATIGSSASEIVVFDLYKGDLGAEAINNFSYTTNGTLYTSGWGSTTFSTMVETNNGSKIKGNFTGTLEGMDSEFNTVTVDMTNGDFNIAY
jgi:hypothetical protein